jgi:methylated-DNA-[protein]-cysteine S-methyltransferase
MYTRHAVIDTPLGDLTVVAEDDALIGVYFPHHWTNPAQDGFGVKVEINDDAVLSSVRDQLVEYLNGDRVTFELPITLHGNPLQQRVWAMLNEIPYGERTTYGALAERLGEKSLSQAVGQAVGHNPISIVVPCHRVLGTNGRLTGYAGGLRRKQFLLDLEEPALIKAARLF